MRSRLVILVFGLILSIILFTPSFTSNTTFTSDNQEITPLYNATRWVIPDTLPWYPIVVVGDNRPQNTHDINPPEIFYDIVNESKQIYPVAFIGTGDHLGIGSKEQFERFYWILKNSSIQNIWLAIGNHDLELHSESMNYWLTYFGPEYMYIDDIPNWRIAIINSETRLSMNWKNQILGAYNDLENRSLIFVFHRPIFPKVNHNLDNERSSIFMNIVKNKDHVKLVLQGHYHGWGMQVKNNITWIITGGAGAPLYSYANNVMKQDLEIINYEYHYMILILYPNQTFTYIPVKMGAGSGELRVEKINNTAYLIHNTKLTIYNTSASIPVRIHYNLSIGSLYIQLFVPPNSNTIVNLEDTGEKYIVKSNATSWYAYLYNETDPDHSPVYKPQNNIIELKCVTPTTTVTSTISTTTTTTITTTITTTTKSTTTTSTSTHQLTETTSTQILGGGGKGEEQYLLYITVAIVVIAIGVTGYLLIKR